MTTIAQTQNVLTQRVVGGVIGGVAGGVVFGVLMGTMGMLPMVAGLVGSDAALVGFLVHMLISVILGIGFSLIFGAQSSSYGQGARWGLVYGAIWWVLGPLVIMPLLMGMGLQFGMALTTPMLMSLVGHILYGVVAGLVFAWYTQR